MVITEKLDGTNAQIHITEAGEVIAGSRNRWITPLNDNAGFARWVFENEDALRALGPGSHFGEWWGLGIQRRYGLLEKRFSLFNVHKWKSPLNEGQPLGGGTRCYQVPVCHVVPELYRGTFDTAAIDGTLAQLAHGGSHAAPGFNPPEGIIVYHEKSGQLFKKTLDKQDGHKGA